MQNHVERAREILEEFGLDDSVEHLVIDLPVPKMTMTGELALTERDSEASQESKEWISTPEKIPAQTGLKLEKQSSMKQVGKKPSYMKYLAKYDLDSFKISYKKGGML